MGRASWQMLRVRGSYASQSVFKMVTQDRKFEKHNYWFRLKMGRGRGEMPAFLD